MTGSPANDSSPRVVIVGSATALNAGPLACHVPRFALASFIDRSDCVIRMNDVKNAWVRGIGRRTDLLMVMNGGGPAWGYTEGPLINPGFLRELSEIVFVVPHAEFVGPRAIPTSDPHHGTDFSDRIVQRQGWAGKMRTTIDPDVAMELDRQLRLRVGRECVASTGIRAIFHVLASARFAGWRIYVVGFGFVGWKGHAFDAERTIVCDLVTQGRLRVPQRVSFLRPWLVA